MTHKQTNTKNSAFKTKRKNGSPQDITNTTPTSSSHLNSFHNNHPLPLKPQSCRNNPSTSERPIHTKNLQRIPISHIAVQQPTIEDTNEQTVEQPHLLNFCARNNHHFSTR